jgi:hypothetical protein
MYSGGDKIYMTPLETWRFAVENRNWDYVEAVSKKHTDTAVTSDCVIGAHNEAELIELLKRSL